MRLHCYRLLVPPCVFDEWVAFPVLVRSKSDAVNNNADISKESHVGCDLVLVSFSLLTLVLVFRVRVPVPVLFYHCSCSVDHAADIVDSADHAKEGRDDCGLGEVFAGRKGILRRDSSSR